MTQLTAQASSTRTGGNPGRGFAKTRRGERFGDRSFRWMTLGFGLVVLAILGTMVLILAGGAWPAIRHFGPAFLWHQRWDPGREDLGALPFIYGTIASSVLALLIAVPLGIGTALFLVELASPWLRRPAGFLVEMLAAIPSVVYGFWGLLVLVPFLARYVQPSVKRTAVGLDESLHLPGHLLATLFGGPTYGRGLFTASLVLAVMVLPYIAAVSRDVFSAVPRAQREAALGLGATRWQMIWTAVLPYGLSGVVGASFLALGRALGETMAVTMLIGNRHEITLSLFGLTDSMASVIANEFPDPANELTRSALIEIGLVLFLVTMLMNVAARLLVWRAKPRGL